MLRIRTRCFFDPWIRDCKKNPDPRSGMNIPDLIFQNFVSVFWVKIKKFFNSLMQIRIRDLVNPGTGIRDGKDGSEILDLG
jgi:hypothetical protein